MRLLSLIRPSSEKSRLVLKVCVPHWKGCSPLRVPVWAPPTCFCKATTLTDDRMVIGRVCFGSETQRLQFMLCWLYCFWACGGREWGGSCLTCGSWVLDEAMAETLCSSPTTATENRRPSLSSGHLCSGLSSPQEEQMTLFLQLIALLMLLILRFIKQKPIPPFWAKI